MYLKYQHQKTVRGQTTPITVLGMKENWHTRVVQWTPREELKGCGHSYSFSLLGSHPHCPQKVHWVPVPGGC